MRWISVNERLPARDSILRCWVLRYSLFHDSYYVARDIWVFDRWAVYPFVVVAWMPKTESETMPGVGIGSGNDEKSKEVRGV